MLWKGKVLVDETSGRKKLPLPAGNPAGPPPFWLVFGVMQKNYGIRRRAMPR